MLKTVALLFAFTTTPMVLMVQSQTTDKGAAIQPREKPVYIGGSLTPPVLIYSVEPEFSEKVRKKKLKGDVQIYLWVDENGNTSHVRVIKGLGMGLDEKAVEAVRQYKFKPAMQNGKPVKVDLYINVNFEIF